MVLNLVTLQDVKQRQVLKQKSDAIDKIDDEIKSFCHNLLETMYFYDGIGLASVQVGVLKQIFVIDIPDLTEQPLLCINPTITQYGKTKHKQEEGCLSIPNVRYLVKRPTEIVLQYTDLQNVHLQLQADGLLARCIQHEYDHLQGILYFDKISTKKDKIQINELLKTENLDAYFND